MSKHKGLAKCKYCGKNEECNDFKAPSCYLVAEEKNETWKFRFKRAIEAVGWTLNDLTPMTGHKERSLESVISGKDDKFPRSLKLLPEFYEAMKKNAHIVFTEPKNEAEKLGERKE